MVLEVQTQYFQSYISEGFMKKTLLLIMVLLCTMALLFSQSFAEEHESKEQRIVSLAPNITEIICELGSIDNLVGRTDYCNYPNEVLSITSVGTLYEPNIEVILSLEPTVVIASSIVDPAFVQSLEKAGIKTVQIYKEESLNGTYDLIAEVASAIGKETEGQVVINSMKERINAVQQKVSSIKEEDKKAC
ncbi:MAG: ABC transporter substrate-binding protein, partial [Sphaerochaetaceae bacterium]|nr:ABC transporter substrate-binding protein [Sphaerochaetaceae bacterium]